MKYVGFDTEKPILAVLIDDSQSLQAGGVQLEQSKLSLQSFSKDLLDNYEIEPLLFSNVTAYSDLERLKHSGSETNMSSALRFVKEQYVNKNLGGVVLVSDGIYNAGSKPDYVAENLGVPVYSVGVGDTTIYADLRVKNVSYNSLAYLGSDFPLQVEIEAKKLLGKQANLSVTQNGKPILSKSINIVTDELFKEIEVVGTANRVGANRIDVKLTSFDSEKNKSNNSYTFYIEVIDGKKKVALWAKSPHPDVGMLKSIISRNDKYEVAASYGDFEIDDQLDLVILHDWFQSPADLNTFEKLRKTGTSIIVVVGDGFNPSLFNEGSQDVKFTPNSGVNSALPLINGAFEYFEISDEQKASIKKWPPLAAPFGKWDGYTPNDIMLYQQIGSVPTKEPLVLLTNTAKSRLGIITGTGIWQWRLAEFEMNENHENLAELVNKMVQFLAVKENKQLLNVDPSAKQYGAGDEITLLGELYNQSLDAITGEEINIDLIDSEDKVYKHTMSAYGKQYKLELNSLEEGAYRYTASSIVGGVKLRDKGNFVILGQQKELLNLSADFNLLRSVAYNSKGQFYTIGQLDVLSNYLNTTDAAKSIISEQTKLQDLIKLKWVFWLLVLLLFIEWFIRKWAGGY